MHILPVYTNSFVFVVFVRENMVVIISWGFLRDAREQTQGLCTPGKLSIPELYPGPCAVPEIFATVQNFYISKTSLFRIVFSVHIKLLIYELS